MSFECSEMAKSVPAFSRICTRDANGARCTVSGLDGHRGYEGGWAAARPLRHPTYLLGSHPGEEYLHERLIVEKIEHLRAEHAHVLRAIVVELRASLVVQTPCAAACSLAQGVGLARELAGR